MPAAANVCTHFFQNLQIIRGMHVIFMEKWLKVFPRSSMLALKSEDYFVDAKSAVLAAISFLELPAPDPSALEAMLSAGQNTDEEVPPMLPQAREILTRFYAPYNVRLSKLLADKSFLSWNPKGNVRTIT
jgi:hypothetical protein